MARPRAPLVFKVRLIQEATYPASASAGRRPGRHVLDDAAPVRDRQRARLPGQDADGDDGVHVGPAERLVQHDAAECNGTTNLLTVDEAPGRDDHRERQQRLALEGDRRSGPERHGHLQGRQGDDPDRSAGRRRGRLHTSKMPLTGEPGTRLRPCRFHLVERNRPERRSIGTAFPSPRPSGGRELDARAVPRPAREGHRARRSPASTTTSSSRAPTAAPAAAPSSSPPRRSTTRGAAGRPSTRRRATRRSTRRPTRATAWCAPR